METYCNKVNIQITHRDDFIQKVLTRISKLGREIGLLKNGAFQ